MLKNSNVEVVYQIERYIPDIKTKTVKVEIATGSIIDGIFVSDNRGLIKQTISNIRDKNVQKSEALKVDSNGQVTLSEMPIDNNDLEINEVSKFHTTGQLVDCEGYFENDFVTIKYYYTKIGRDWFNETAVFISDEHPEYAGLNDREYNSKRLWTILLEMGKVSGEVI